MRYQTAPFRPDPRSETIELLFYRALKHPYKHPYEAVNSRLVVDPRPDPRSHRAEPVFYFDSSQLPELANDARSNDTEWDPDEPGKAVRAYQRSGAHRRQYGVPLSRKFAPASRQGARPPRDAS